MLFPLRKGPLPARTGVINGWSVTSYFGGRVDPLTGRAGNHGGMDLAYPGCAGEPMIAVADGTVTQAWDPSGGGWWTSLTTDQGTFGYGHASRYADPDGTGPETNYSGWRVKAGTVIAYVGTSGGSTGPHLHFAWLPPGGRSYADPFDLLVTADLPVVATAVATPTFAVSLEDEFDMATPNEVILPVVAAVLNAVAAIREDSNSQANRVIEALENIQANLAGVTRSESDEVVVALVNVQGNLAGVMREQQAAGAIPADVDVVALAALVAGRLAVTAKDG